MSAGAAGRPARAGPRQLRTAGASCACWAPSWELVEPGRVEITLPYRADLCQQNGYLHAGISTTIADTAGGYAATACSSRARMC